MTELCDDGSRLYGTALSMGRISRADVETAPCLVELGFLHPDPDDSRWLRPVMPFTALAQRLHPLEREISERRRLATELTDVFTPFMAISAQATGPTHAITVLEGVELINGSLNRATAECRSEMLTVQPSGRRRADILVKALERDKSLVERGVRVRTIYQHTARHSAEILGYVDRIANTKVEIRTIDELAERLIICDETVAFIPASDDRQIALELRHPGLVRYLIKVFELIWGRAVPLQAAAPYETALDGITEIQHSIAKLLVEGHVDEAIARRLGMNVRTCRGHIAKLSSILGSGSRAQLGYLIAQSGILEQHQ
uniref:helix-turn-helix transcriptional regulator n=1 Tax=Streptomyces polyasparticus TaxID=2767826 RepID=UPI003F684E97